MTVRATAVATFSGLRGVVGLGGAVEPSAGVPVIGAVVDAASLRQPLAPGSLISVFGQDLATGFEQATADSLPGNLAGAAIFVSGRRVPLLAAIPTQINGVLPIDLPALPGQQLGVRQGRRLSVPIDVTVVPRQPAIFTKSQTGQGQGIVVLAETWTLAEPGTPARTGDTLILFAGGLGNVEPPVTAGLRAPLQSLSRVSPVPVTVSIGGVTVTPLFAGLAPGLFGVYQVNVTTPPNVPAGDRVPVVLGVGEQESPPVTIAVAPPG